MRALVFDGSSTSLVERHASAHAASDEVVVRPRKALVTSLELAVSRSGLNLERFRGFRGLRGFQGVPGHAFVGVVESAGGKAGAALVGRRVVASPVISCRTCDLCHGGLSQHCRQRRIVGVLEHDGGLAEAVVMPAVNCISVPDSVDDDHAVFAAPAGAAIQAARQVRIEGRPYITVLGETLTAFLSVQIMARLNASVRLIGQSADRIALCEKWGIKHRLASEIGRRSDQDVVVVCSGSGSGFALALGLVRPRGSIILPGLAEEPIDAEVLDQISLKEVMVIGSSFGPVAEGLGLIQRGELDVVSLISRRMRLADGPAIVRHPSENEPIAIMVDI